MATATSGKSADQVLLLNRQVVLNDLRQRYARFGDELVRYLSECAFKRGGVRRAIGKALHPVPLDEARMHEAFLRFLATEGVEAFFARVAEKGNPTLLDVPLETRLEHDHAQAFLFQPAVSERPRSQQSSPAADTTVDPAGTETTSTEAAWGGVERRSGCERRLGVERRLGKDRRNDVELIDKNQRFGGDRRSGVDRRERCERRQSPPPPNS